LCISAFIYTVPIGVIQAITNQQVGLNVITELIIGYALPGRPIAMMMFKTWGYITMTQALQFTSDFKLGHYMKIAHRPMFFCQVAATIVAGTVQLGVQAWMFSNIEGLCSADQKDGFICPSTTVFGTASIIVSFVPLLHTFDFRCSISVVCIIVGCHWTTASVLARSALLRAHLLLPGWRPCTVVTVDFTQEVQDQFPQISQLPDHLHQHRQLASCNPS
jgi:OPT family oligopeptide transporter